MVAQNSGAIANPIDQYLPPGQTPLNMSLGPWGQGQWTGTGGGTTATQYDTFLEFNKLFGRNPTQSELDQYSSYFKSGDPNITNAAGGNQAISSYYNQQQQAAQAPQQEADALQKQIPILNNLIQNQTQAASAGLMDPNNPIYQQFSGLLNNMGITPSSGAFQSALGSTIGNNANQAINAALGQVGLPIASGYSQGAMAPFMQSMQQPQDLFKNNLQFQNALQEIQALPQQGGNGMWGDVIGGALGGAAAGGMKGGLPGALAGGAAGGGAGYARSRDTYICTELCNLGLLTRDEVEKIHAHLFRAKWKKPLLFLTYFVFGKLLVNMANKVRTVWSLWKPLFYDEVMAEPDPVKAVLLYEDAFWRLFRIVRERLRFVYHPGSAPRGL